MSNPTDMRREEVLRVLVTKEGEAWIAVCLENNIVVQSDNQAQIIDQWGRAYLANVVLAVSRKLPPLQNAKPAPRHYHELWNQARKQRNAWRSRVDFDMIPADVPAEADFELAVA